MPLRLVMRSDLLRELQWMLLDSDEGLWFPAGVASAGDTTEILLPGPPGDLADASVHVVRAPDLQHLRPRTSTFMRPASARALHVEMGLLDRRGCVTTAFKASNALPVDEVLLQGPGMDRWFPGQDPPPLRGEAPASGLHSRYAGALGGRHVHGRLSQIAWLGIGSARLGSLFAVSLAKAGCSLVLVDPDRLEDHSVDSVDCEPEIDLGTSKANAVARFATRIAPWAHVHGLSTRAQSEAALAAAKRCRAIFSCPDRDDARFAASLMAVALHRVHVDLGTGVFEEAGEWRAGADIRVLLPGQGCLVCVGGVDLAAEPPADWRRQRAGSLRSLNQVAANMGMLQFERLVVGGLRRSTWTRLEVAADGRVTTRQMPVQPRRDCALCSRWSGAGDAAFRLETDLRPS